MWNLAVPKANFVDLPSSGGSHSADANYYILFFVFQPKGYREPRNEIGSLVHYLKNRLT